METSATGTVTIELRCNKCGSDDVSIPETEGSHDPIVCNACGAHNGTRAALDQQVGEQISKQLQSDLDAVFMEAFGSNPNVRISKSG